MSCTDQGQGCHKLWSTINSTLNMRLKTGGFHPNETILFSKRTRTCLSKHPRTTGARTCAVRHAFASCINRLLALLLGGLKMTVFTARTVPITAEEQTGTVQVKGQPHSKPAVWLQGPEDGRARCPGLTGLPGCCTASTRHVYPGSLWNRAAAGQGGPK